MIRLVADQTQASRLAFYLLAYGAWLVAVALAALILALWHTAALNLYVAAGLNKWGFQRFGTWTALLLVLAWLVLVIVLEHWFSRAADAARLRRRVSRVMLLEVVLLGLTYLASAAAGPGIV